MLQRSTQWLCYILALSTGFWSPVRGVTVKTPPGNPATVQAQAKFFQDFFSVQLSPYKIEFGHVCEDPHNWEQRYEKKDYKNHRDMGKVRWGDKKGGYGEHYWDLNHAGHAGDHHDDGYDGNSDDGSYHVKESPNEHYDDGPSDHSSYSNDDYDPEKSSYEENGRAKRAHPRAKAERKPQKEYEQDSDQRHTIRKQKGKKAEQLEAAPSHIEDYSEEEEEAEPEPEIYKKVPKKRQQYRNKDEYQPKEEKNQVVLVVKEKDEAPVEQYTQTPQQYTQTPQPELSRYVNYEGGAGVRQHQQPEASASAPRLFLEHATGRVVDRSTGQAYILQPILNY